MSTVYIHRTGLLTCPHCGFAANTVGGSRTSIDPEDTPAKERIFLCGNCYKPSRSVKNGLLICLTPCDDSEFSPAERASIVRIRRFLAECNPQTPQQHEEAAKAAIIFRLSLIFPGHPGGAPLYWRDETSGRAARIVGRFLEGGDLPMTDLEFLRQYCQHWITAPCWQRNPFSALLPLPPGEGRDEGMASRIDALTEQIKLVTTTAELRAWLRAAQEIGIDPL